MMKKILFWLFIFILLNMAVGDNSIELYRGVVSFFIELLIYGGYKIFKIWNKKKLELILDTYKAKEKYEVKGKVAISKKLFYLEKKLKSLPNKNGAIQLKKLIAMTQNFKDIISLDIKEDKKTINDYKYAVEQVYQAISDNLQHYYLVMKSVEPINSKIMYEASIYSADEKKDLAQEWSTLFSKQKNAQEMYWYKMSKL